MKYFWLLSTLFFFSFSLTASCFNFTPKSNQPNRFTHYILAIIFFTICIILSVIHKTLLQNYSLLSPLTLIIIALISYLALYAIIHKFNLFKKFNLVNFIESSVKFKLILLSSVSLLITIVASAIIFTNAFKFFEIVSIKEFIFGGYWNPVEYELYDGQAFGLLPVLFGTLFVSFIALSFGLPLGFLSAIFLTFYCPRSIKQVIRGIFETLAGIPTVVYGFFAAFFISPMLVNAVMNHTEISISLENFLVPSITIGIMITPYVAILLDDAFGTTPKSLLESSIAMGLSKSEIIKYICIPYSSDSIIDTIIIVFSRAIGETIIVAISCGALAFITLNPLNSGTTITTQIVLLLSGDVAFDNPRTLSAFALSAFLVVFSTVINSIAVYIKYKISKTKID